MLGQPAMMFARTYLHSGQNIGEVPGQGSLPSATAGVAVDKVVASSIVTARIRRRLFTVQLLSKVVVHRQCP